MPPLEHAEAELSKISLFILYSRDRLPQLERTLGCLADMDGISDCQKILCSDGPTDVWPEGFEIVEVSRRWGKYCWADAWAAAVERSANPIIWYLDADRAFPKDYILRIVESSRPGNLVYAARSYRLLRDMGLEELRSLRDRIAVAGGLAHIGSREIETEEISTQPGIDYRKNPCSGSFAIWKDTYQDTGGFDERYLGWGFPDTDFFMQLKSKNVKVSALDSFQLHQFHGYSVPDVDFLLDNTWNGTIFARKWGLGTDDIGAQLRKLGIDPARAFACESFDQFEALCDKPKLARALRFKSSIKKILPRRVRSSIFERYRKGPTHTK